MKRFKEITSMLILALMLGGCACSLCPAEELDPYQAANFDSGWDLTEDTLYTVDPDAVLTQMEYCEHLESGVAPYGNLRGFSATFTNPTTGA